MTRLRYRLTSWFWGAVVGLGMGLFFASVLFGTSIAAGGLR